MATALVSVMFFRKFTIYRVGVTNEERHNMTPQELCNKLLTTDFVQHMRKYISTIAQYTKHNSTTHCNLSFTLEGSCDQVKVKVSVQISTLHMFFRLYLPPGSGRLRQPATIDPTLDLCTRYPLWLGGPRQCGIRSLPDTSTHGQRWESNPRPSDLESNALSTWPLGVN